MTHEFKVGDEVWVRGIVRLTNASPATCEYVEVKTFGSKVVDFLFIERTNIKPIETPFLFDGRTYQCRGAHLTATVFVNSHGCWCAKYSDGQEWGVTPLGYYWHTSDKDDYRDLIALLPEPKVCECCGQTMKETKP